MLGGPHQRRGGRTSLARLRLSPGCRTGGPGPGPGTELSRGVPHLEPPQAPRAGTALTTPPRAELLLEESCADAQDGELDGLWTTISIFITLFLLSVCYSATVTLFKVSGPAPLSPVPRSPLPAPPWPSLWPRCHCDGPSLYPPWPLVLSGTRWLSGTGDRGAGRRTLGGGPRAARAALTPCALQVKWIFSPVVELKRTIVPDYRNMIGQGA